MASSRCAFVRLNFSSRRNTLPAPSADPAGVFLIASRYDPFTLTRTTTNPLLVHDEIIFGAFLFLKARPVHFEAHNQNAFASSYID
jgi:hypothetical protein